MEAFLTEVRFSDNNLTVAVSNGSHLHILRKENKKRGICLSFYPLGVSPYGRFEHVFV